MKKRWLLSIVLIALLAAFFSPVSALAVPDAEGLYTHIQLFSDDFCLTGVYSECAQTFFTGRWEIENAKLSLYIEGSPLFEGGEQLFVTLNDTRVFEAAISELDNGQLEIDLPNELIVTNGMNTLNITARLYGDTDFCADAATFSNWLNIYKQSFVSVTYRPAAPVSTIAEFYSAFTSIDAMDNNQSAICIPETASAETFSAAAYALAGMAGNAVLEYENIGLRSISKASDLYGLKYAVLIADYDKLPTEVVALLSQGARNTAQKGAVVALVQYEDTHLLVITGAEADALKNAGVLLANRDMVSYVEQTERAILADEDYHMSKWRIGQYLELGSHDIILDGLFEQTAQYIIDFPANRTVAFSSQLSLDFAHSAELNFERSLLSVYINDKPIGSRALSARTARGSTVVLDIPQDIKISGSFSIKVVFNLDPGDDWCRIENMPWARIDSTSMLKLASYSEASLLFENYPSPFVVDGSFDNVLVILPDEPSYADIESLRLIMLTLGRYLRDNTGALRVSFASDAGDVENANIISIGKAVENKVALENSDSLCFSYGTQGYRLHSKATALGEGTGALGTLELMRSPHSEWMHGILVVSAVTNQGLLNASSYLGSQNLLWQLSGDAIAVSGDDLYCFDYHEKHSALSPIAPARIEDIQGESYLPIIGGALFILFAGIVMLVFKYKRKEKP